jgi:nucleoside-diphosphate-sugar epimerase
VTGDTSTTFGPRTAGGRDGRTTTPPCRVARHDLAGCLVTRFMRDSVGRRDAYQPTLWLDDAGTAVAASALVAPAGTYNVADDDPPTRAEIDAALAAVVGRRALRPPVDEIPPELEPLGRSQRVCSRKLQETTGWTPRVRAGTDGWRLTAEEAWAA